MKKTFLLPNFLPLPPPSPQPSCPYYGDISPRGGLTSINGINVTPRTVGYSHQIYDELLIQPIHLMLEN